jgi:hypothetical protein
MLGGIFMWSLSMDIKYDENGKPITIFSKNPSLTIYEEEKDCEEEN